MELEDIGLQLCSKEPIYVGKVPIYPISLQTIARIGYKKYSAEIRFLCATPIDVQAMTGEDISEIGVYRYLVQNAIKDPKVMEIMIFWFSQITHSSITFSAKKMCFIGNSFLISKENFDEIQAIIKMRNGLQDLYEEDENPDNEAARRVLQRRKEERLKRRKAKSTDEDGSAITLADLVSILASGHGMLMDTVMEYDLYQFNDQFNRLKIMDDYEVSVQALLHGAKKENVNLTHWITKIKRDSE